MNENPNPDSTNILVDTGYYEKDDKGRPHVEFMSDSDKLTELVLTTRALADALEELGQNPMLMALMPKGLKL